MFYLFFQTWIWILAAGLLGLFVGWLIWGRGESNRAPATDPADVARLKQELADCRLRCNALESAADKDHATATTAPETVAKAAAVEPETAQTPGSSEDEEESGELSDDWRPEGLTEARAGGADDLKRIRGIGPVIERTLNELGIYHFDQIAAFDDDNIRWVDNYIAFPGRILREQWVSQAAELAGGGATDFSDRYDRDDK